MKISCITIDDDSEALNLLKKHLSKIDLFDIKGQFTSGIDALAFLRTTCVNVIFTEITLPSINGFELAATLPSDQKFIFITRHQEYALHSFSYRVIDYILKPLSQNRLFKGVEKLIAEARVDANFQMSPDSVFFRSGGKMMRIDFNDILFVKGEKEYVSLNLRDERLLIYKRMKDMESLLPLNFIRVHISYIINVNYLLKVDNRHLVIGTERIPIGDSYRAQLQRYVDTQSF
jgi:two-component system, LytTR family, response regulator